MVPYLFMNMCFKDKVEHISFKESKKKIGVFSGN